MVAVTSMAVPQSALGARARARGPRNAPRAQEPPARNRFDIAARARRWIAHRRVGARRRRDEPAPGGVCRSPPAWARRRDGGAGDAPASRLYLVLAAGQRSAETSGKADELKKKADELGELFQKRASAQSERAKKAVEAQIKKHFEGKTNKEIA